MKQIRIKIWFKIYLGSQIAHGQKLEEALFVTQVMRKLAIFY